MGNEAAVLLTTLLSLTLQPCLISWGPTLAGRQPVIMEQDGSVISYQTNLYSMIPLTLIMFFYLGDSTKGQAFLRKFDCQCSESKQIQMLNNSESG